MSDRDTLIGELRHYRRQHRECIRRRNWWVQLTGCVTGQARWHEQHAAQCRDMAREKINLLRESRQ